MAQICSCSRCLPLLGNRPLAAMDAKQVAPDNKNRAIAEEGSLLNLKSPGNALVTATRTKTRHENPASQRKIGLAASFRFDATVHLLGWIRIDLRC